VKTTLDEEGIKDDIQSEKLLKEKKRDEERTTFVKGKTGPK
jgi:hypothetical protein